MLFTSVMDVHVGKEREMLADTNGRVSIGLKLMCTTSTL